MLLRESTKPTQPLPVERDKAKIWYVDGLEVFTSYTPTPLGPVFMEMLKRTFGEGQTTRTRDVDPSDSRPSARTGNQTRYGRWTTLCAGHQPRRR
jgi:hypothetical protein